MAAQQYISPGVRATAAAAAKNPKPTIEITPTEWNNYPPLSESGASVVAKEGADTVGVREEEAAVDLFAGAWTEAEMKILRDSQKVRPVVLAIILLSDLSIIMH